MEKIIKKNIVSIWDNPGAGIKRLNEADTQH